MNTITVEELEWLLERGEVDLLDVRPQNDFQQQHVNGARSLPLSKLGPHSFVVSRRGDESFPLCVMCDRTLRASLAAGMIAGAGLTNLCVLKGGLQAWVMEGLPTVKHHGSLTHSRWLAYLVAWVRSAVALFQRRSSLRQLAMTQN